MDRKAIRDLTRMLADELTEADEGLMSNDNLNTLINIAQDKVVMRLAPSVPNEFIKNTTFSVTADKGEYDIESDIGLSDCLAITEILHNVSGKMPAPLVYVPDVDDLYEYGEVGETGVMQYWGYDSDSEIWIRKIPASDETGRFKLYYLKERADLSTDGASPDMPKVCHPLIAYDVLYNWAIRGAPNNVERVWKIYQREQGAVINLLKQNFSISTGMKPSVKEVLQRNAIG